MPPLLLPVIYLAFVALGLPDSALGSAWPSMYGELGAGVSWAGAISAIVCAGTILSSVMSVRVVERLGTGRTCALSVGTTAVALLGYSCCTEFWQVCLWAVPYGLGAGAVDAALNSYVSVHYASRHMSWLHCMWGVGASGGPVIMAWCLAGGTWADGFRAIGLLQVAITVVLTASLPLWARAERGAALAAEPAAGGGSSGTGPDDPKNGSSGPVPDDPSPAPTRRELLRIPGVREVLVCFFCYSALEMTCGAWASSYCTLVRGIDASTAASWASLFYVGITAGRGLSGFLTMRLSDENLIRLGQAVIVAGVALLALPLPDVGTLVGLVLVGLGCAPVYPSIIHATPARFGEANALALTGLQMAFAYTGSLVMSPLFGLLAEWVSPALYPAYLGVLVVVMAVMAERANRVIARR